MPKKKRILKETGGIPSLRDIYCLWTKWYKYGNRCVLGCSDGAGHPCLRWSLNMSSWIPALRLAAGMENERLGVKCSHLLLLFSFPHIGDYLSMVECWLVARGFEFLDPAPYSPIPDFGNNSSANHQLSIFISGCFCDVETIFSTAENHEDKE